MATVSDDVIARAAYDAGFRGNDLPIAVAVALAESGGRPDAHNTLPPDDSYGLWQINYYGKLKDSRTQQFGPGSSLFDPTACARAAFAVAGSHGDGHASWRPWSTYTAGTYRLFLPRGYQAVARMQVIGMQGSPSGPGGKDGNVNVNPPPTGVIGGIADAGRAASSALKGLDAVGAFFGALLEPGNWLRIGEVLGGVLVVLIALVLINRDAIAQVVPGGGAVAAAVGV